MNQERGLERAIQAAAEALIDKILPQKEGQDVKRNRLSIASRAITAALASGELHAADECPNAEYRDLVVSTKDGPCEPTLEGIAKFLTGHVGDESQTLLLIHLMLTRLAVKFGLPVSMPQFNKELQAELAILKRNRVLQTRTDTGQVWREQ